MARPNPSHWRRTVFGAVALAGLVLSGCASNAPQDTFKAEGPDARKIKNLAMWIGPIAIGVGILVGAALIFTVLKYRDKGDGRAAKQFHGNLTFELVSITIPAALLIVISVFTVSVIFDLADKPAGAMEISVVGQQWWWEFSYPDSQIVTANEMVIPAETDVYLSLTSRDVIHSFWIPRLAGKKDAVPGRVHKLNIRADHPGDYWGQCSEFCGLSHANMRMRVRVLSKADFAAWKANQVEERVAPATAAATAGERVYAAKCASCHQINGVLDAKKEKLLVDASASLISGAAPNLTHFASRSVFAGATFATYLDDPKTAPNEADPYSGGAVLPNRAQLEAWLRDPPKEIPMASDQKRGMPNLHLTEQEINDLADYLYSLK